MSWHETADHGAPEKSAVAGSHTDEEARNTSDPAADQLRPGQVVQARLRGVVHWVGTVDTVSIALEVVWIRENGLGERKLLDLREYQVQPHEDTDT